MHTHPIFTLPTAEKWLICVKIVLKSGIFLVDIAEMPYICSVLNK